MNTMLWQHVAGPVGISVLLVLSAFGVQLLPHAIMTEPGRTRVIWCRRLLGLSLGILAIVPLFGLR